MTIEVADLRAKLLSAKTVDTLIHAALDGTPVPAGPTRDALAGLGAVTPKKITLGTETVPAGTVLPKTKEMILKGNQH